MSDLLPVTPFFVLGAACLVALLAARPWRMVSSIESVEALLGVLGVFGLAACLFLVVTTLTFLLFGWPATTLSGWEGLL